MQMKVDSVLSLVFKSSSSSITAIQQQATLNTTSASIVNVTRVSNAHALRASLLPIPTFGQKSYRRGIGTLLTISEEWGNEKGKT